MLRGSFGRWGFGALIAVLAAAWPASAAAEEGARELGTPADMGTALLLLGLGLLGTFVVASLGFLYRRQRGLRWAYQLPEGALSEGDPSAGSSGAEDEDSH